MNHRKNELIAVVDNDPMMLKSLLRLLDANGYSAKGFASAETFLDSEGATPQASCLVLDINLDGISGIELQQQLAASGSRLPIVFITAMNDEAVEREARAGGCAAYLRKPFAGKLLIGAIKKAAAT